MKQIFHTIIFIAFLLDSGIVYSSATNGKIELLLRKMTLEEKVGQLNQYSDPNVLTGDIEASSPEKRQVYFKKGMVGSVLNVLGVEKVRAMQKAAVEETRLGIPLIFAYDVIHGYRTTFPIPLAESASWDLDAIERSARIAAVEASASGVNWTFAPMVDIYRDPRWGRVMEGAGEDAFLGSRIAEVRIKGFQGEDLSATDTIAACAKHFAAYGAVTAGREYHTVDVSKRNLWEVYLPPFEASVKAGVRTFMNAFNEYDGIPASGNRYLMRDILRGQWGFDGVVVSDWGSYHGMINFGVVSDKAGAAKLALMAGSDIDMESDVYSDALPALVREGKVSEALLDDAVRRVLQLKFDLGLFTDPYRYMDKDREKRLIHTPEHIEATRDMARKSIVLLKNKKLLPLNPKQKSIAVIGPLADSKEHMNGFWSAQGKANDVVTLLEGIKSRVSKNTKVLYAKGSEIEKSDKNLLRAAIKVAKKSDVVVLAVGEDSVKTGEASSRLSIDLYEAQKALVKAIHATGIPVVMILMNGRPISIPWSAKNIPAIVEGWFLGNEAGNALADVLFGDYNPSGKLTMTVPVSVGQIPIYYNQKRGNRPYNPGSRFTTKYVDGPNDPLYPFGHGLSYTVFDYSEIELDKNTFSVGESLTVTVTITNSGDRAGHEVVQLYIQDMVSSVIRPVKELRGFQKIALAPGEKKRLSFKITEKDLAFYNREMNFVTEPGEFKVYIGRSSADLKETVFNLIKK